MAAYGYCFICLEYYRVFARDVTAAILVSQKNEMAAMLVSQTNPMGFKLCFYSNLSHCFRTPI